VTDHSHWMSNPEIQNLTFGELKIPGTHDSASYSLTQTLSQISYDDIAFLWSLSPESAPADGSYPWVKGTYYVGPVTYAFILGVVRNVAAAQDRDIMQQLSAGIRYFDLRVYHDTRDDDFYVQHGLRGCTLKLILEQVQAFIEMSPSKELIVLNVSHTQFGSDAPALTARVAALVNDYIGGHVYMPPGAAGTNFDFQSLSTHTVASMTRGKTAVMLLNTDEGYTYATTFINTTGFADSGRSAGGVDTVDALRNAELGPLKANPKGRLYQISWTLTPQRGDIITQIKNSILGNTAPPVLQQLAQQANDALTAFIDANAEAAFNLITVDFQASGRPESVVDICVRLNTAPRKRISDPGSRIADPRSVIQDL
jgi:hypothetical protein